MGRIRIASAVLAGACVGMAVLFGASLWGSGSDFTLKAAVAVAFVAALVAFIAAVQRPNEPHSASHAPPARRTSTK